MHLTGIAARIAYAVLVGVITFIIILIVGIVVAKSDAEVGSLLKNYSALLGLLASIVTFFARPNPSV